MQKHLYYTAHSRLKKLLLLTLVTLLIPVISSAKELQKSPINLAGKIIDATTQKPLPYSTIVLKRTELFIKGSIAKKDGSFLFTQLKKGSYRIQISFLGYSTLTKQINLEKDTIANFALLPTIQELKGVVVTATENRGLTTSSTIGSSAMNHLQPSSFSDILALLPGNTTQLPNLTAANVIRLREVGVSSSDYAVSAMGTQFVMDGHAINTDANMQYVAQGGTQQDDSRNTTNYGVDMRSISTDNIEKVEVIRGIPSVSYGELTSGVVQITRKLEATPFEVRLKADQYGKLVHISKGFTWSEGKNTISADIGILDSRADPRNKYENYKRLSSSLRYKRKWEVAKGTLQLRSSFDYTTTVDVEKSDLDLQRLQEDDYKSAYQSLRSSNRIQWFSGGNSWLQKIDFKSSVSYSHDKITRNKFVQLDRDYAIPYHTEAGVYDAEILPYKYVSHLVVDGKPFTAQTQLEIQGSIGTNSIKNSWKVGAEWRYSKNFGKGQVYDVKRPINPSTSLRPRSYNSIPGKSVGSFYMENKLNTTLCNHRLILSLGLRGNSLLNVNENYNLHGKVYIDPRVNLQWQLPTLTVASKPLQTSITIGVGKLTMMPSISQLYPATKYYDFLQLNYYHENPLYRRINQKSYALNTTPYDIQPTTNQKMEVRLNLNYRKGGLAITYFQEKMTDGFRYMNQVAVFSYKKYDTSSINSQTLTDRPALEDLAYTNTAILGGFGKLVNGSEIRKKGIEFQGFTPRFSSLHTRITLTGAWLSTTYKNSQPMYDFTASQVILGTSVNDKYVGKYNWSDGSEKQQLNTNFIVDTYFKSIGLNLSSTFECIWFSSTQRLYKDGYPISYIDNKGQTHPYTSASEKDAYLQWLVKQYDSSLFSKNKEPFYGYINLKASKDFGKKMQVSLFVDRILDYLPSYTSGSYTVRRTSNPYFGMEMKLKF